MYDEYYASDVLYIFSRYVHFWSVRSECINVRSLVINYVNRKNRVKEKCYEHVYFKTYDYLCFFYGAWKIDQKR